MKDRWEFRLRTFPPGGRLHQTFYVAWHLDHDQAACEGNFILAIDVTSTFSKGAPWCFHLHEPVVHGDLDVCRVRLHRGQHRALPCQQVERS